MQSRIISQSKNCMTNKSTIKVCVPCTGIACLFCKNNTNDLCFVLKICQIHLFICIMSSIFCLQMDPYFLLGSTLVPSMVCSISHGRCWKWQEGSQLSPSLTARATHHPSWLTREGSKPLQKILKLLQWVHFTVVNACALHYPSPDGLTHNGISRNKLTIQSPSESEPRKSVL